MLHEHMFAFWCGSQMYWTTPEVTAESAQTAFHSEVTNGSHTVMHLTLTEQIIDPKGNPGNFREGVDKLPIRPSEARVRARSASDGSGTSGAAGPKPACCRVDTCHGSKASQAKDARRRSSLTNSKALRRCQKAEVPDYRPTGHSRIHPKTALLETSR